MHQYEHVLNGYSGTFDNSLLEYIRQSPAIKYVERNHIYTTATTQYNSTWGLARISRRKKIADIINLKFEHESRGGNGITVYVVDTGINTNHIDFEGRASWGTNVIINEGSIDGNGHGTHVAGTIGSKTYGVAKKAKLVAVKVLNTQGQGDVAGVLKGLDYVVKANLIEQNHAVISGRAPQRMMAFPELLQLMVLLLLLLLGIQIKMLVITLNVFS
ncbi:hypothetical protein BB561_006429 [Smittium simulii]|uniref:Peptidase S8/S53 domain-containing protein n=1 Tax=Smittium simulii TaxID=133385 RepID=A0A2T9Y4E1_9FUNG|nr:hypothetical protein BB561_006429 [Smittium simulii]